MAKALIVYYSLGGNTREAAEIAEQAVRKEGHFAKLKTGLEADTNDLLDCDGIIIGTPDYFSLMAGGLKDFFDRTLYPSKGKAEGKPYFAFVTHGGGGKALASVEKIAQSFKLKKAAEPVLIKGKPDADARRLLEDAAKNFLASL
jgi:flavodoxin